MKSNTRFLRSILWVWVALTAMASATRNNTNDHDTNTATTPVRLADLQQCPVSPKPMCDDENCEGSRFCGPTQFRCGSERPFPDSDGRSLILAGCRCCPLPIHVECTDCQCAAPEGTRICVSEPLQGCTCQTMGDRVEASKAGIADFGWTSDDEFEIDFEPSDDEIYGETPVAVRMSSVSSSFFPLATMHCLGLLQDYWVADIFEKHS
ncbi:hypothetical protein F5Y14DRAFT_428861 [Nemania sp. NC0429]|nr:hypothetical protein F5Y14DRAFT_428861 [Nemania sp. NC0429]